MSVARYWPILLWVTMAIAAEAPEGERRPALTSKERLSGKAAVHVLELRHGRQGLHGQIQRGLFHPQRCPGLGVRLKRDLGDLATEDRADLL